MRCRAPAEDVRWALVMFLLGLLTARGPSTLDEALHLDRADAWARGGLSLSTDPGELWVPSGPVAGGLFYDRGQGLRAASPPGLSALVLPFVAPLSWLSERPIGDAVSPLSRGGPVEPSLGPLRADLRAIPFALVGPIAASLTLLFFLGAARTVGLGLRARRWGAAALVFGSPLLVYSGTCWTQLPVTALLAYALAQIARRGVSSSEPATGLGLALGVAALVRVECLLFAIPFGWATYQGERRWRRAPSRALLEFILPLAVAVALLVVIGLPSSGGGWSPRTMRAGLPGLLLSPEAGLFVHAPFALLSMLGLHAWRGELLFTPLVGVCATALLVYGGWFDWHASLSYGPRFVVPLLPLLALPFAGLAERHPRLAAGAVALGFVIALPGALIVHARVEEADPLLSLAPLRMVQAISGLDWVILDSTPLAVLLASVATAGLIWERTRT